MKIGITMFLALLQQKEFYTMCLIGQRVV